MRLDSLIDLAKQYALLGIVLSASLAGLLIIGYWLVYKKLLNGQKRLSKGTIALLAISVCYAVVVAGAVFMNRGSYFGTIVLEPFKAYAEAWNGWSAGGWRNIALNILLFAPLGCLLPLWSRRLQRAWRTVLCGFLLSLAIECTQLVAAIGIFEVDDLIGNTFGVAIGYGLVMLALGAIGKTKLTFGRALGYAAPLLTMALVAGGLAAAYSFKELGNLRSAHTYKVDMSRVTLASEVALSENGGTALIYKTETGSAGQAGAMARALLAQSGAELDEAESDIYDEMAFFYSVGRRESVRVTYRGMTYNYTDFTKFDEKIERVSDADESKVRTALGEWGLTLPEDALFEAMEGGTYRFTVDRIVQGEQMLDGALLCEYYSDGTVKEIRNQIVAYSVYRPGDIISETEAYRQLESGKFNFPYRPGTVPRDWTIADVELSYELDTKGFYQPVYRFKCVFVIAGSKREAFVNIAALK